MKTIKDFFYNCSDLIFILFILAAAGGLIYWRVNAIMDYPKTLAVEIQETGTAEGLDIDMAAVEEEQAAAEDEKSEATKDDDSANASDAEGDAKASGDSDNADGTETSDAGSDGADTSDATEETPAELFVDGALTRETTITTVDGTPEEIAQALIDAGIFGTYDEYYEVCVNAGIDPTQIVPGTYTFAAGTTLDAVVSEVTQS